MTSSIPYIVTTVLVIVAVIFTVALGYKLRWPSTLPPTKPFISWFPKYRTVVVLTPVVVENQEPEMALLYRLNQLGFVEMGRDIDQIRFTRGSILGDFSVQIAKVDLTFRLPLDTETVLQVEYGAFAAFDTGDLWKFTTELKDRLEADDFPQSLDFDDED
ncbi:MAG: hypothetical protein ACFCD0_09775 [Gemmataceae bacterium]